MNTNINISRTSASFNGFSGNFRFGQIYLKVNPSVEYNLKYDGTFGLLDIPADRFNHRLISDKSGSKTTVQGSTAANAKCNIELVTNNITCKIE